MIRFNQNARPKPYKDKNAELRKKAKIDFKKYSFKLVNLEKLLKMLENIEMLNLLLQKEEETIWCQNQIIILQSFSQKIY